MSVYLFSAFVIVKANDPQEARRVAEKASDEVESSNPNLARVSLEDGDAELLEEEDW